ncbi:hypothetical protein BDV33DRAFT_172550 [Aspergillus novoparasiticus]|uniref:Uncharacterized protein n=1 Tax=Aspergillus novoparasiticus TaxID=986946 RepID=A0A5N6ESR4_9EURO|nr:hypothetical protein BDV33DRAFT_172550 [Aspergillus novoparasiticus]
MVLKQATRGLDWYSLAIGRCDMSDFGPRSVMYQSVCLFFAFYSFFFLSPCCCSFGGSGFAKGMHIHGLAERGTVDRVPVYQTVLLFNSLWETWFFRVPSQ